MSKSSKKGKKNENLDEPKKQKISSKGHDRDRDRSQNSSSKSKKYETKDNGKEKKGGNDEKEDKTPRTKKTTNKNTKIKNTYDDKNTRVKDSHEKGNIILEVKTTQTGAFKQVIERISNFISDCCIVFIPPDNIVNDDDDYYEEVNESNDDETVEDNINENSKRKKKSKNNDSESSEKELNLRRDKKIKQAKKAKTVSGMEQQSVNTGGIRILRLTEDKSILIKLNLDAANFTYFDCKEPKITIGVDMHNLNSHLKMINDDDPIILYMRKDNRNALYIKSLNGNENNEETDMEIYLMEITNPEMPIPITSFQNKIVMASDKFHLICKRLNNNSMHVEITSVNNEILFRGSNDGGKVTMTYKDINQNSKKKKKKKPDQIVQGLYELRSLMGFSKCNKLCNTIDLYLKNDFPLVLVMTVATLGKMYVFLTPIENVNN